MQVDLNMCFPSLQLPRFYKEISLPHFANGNEITQRSLREEPKSINNWNTFWLDINE